MGDGGEVGGKAITKPLLGLGQEVMFYHYSDFIGGSVLVWISQLFSKLIHPRHSVYPPV